MRAQRAKLAEDLRAETHGDDITAKLMAQVIFIQMDYIEWAQFNSISFKQQKGDAEGGHDEEALRKVFDTELKKYEPKIKVCACVC